MSEPEFDRKKQTIEQGDWCAHCTCDPDVGFMPCELCHDQAVIWDLRKEVERLREALNEFVLAMDRYGHPDKSLRAAKKALRGETCNE